jgi:hypothetical protein
MKTTKICIDYFESEKAGGLVLIACKISPLTTGLLGFLTLKMTLKTTADQMEKKGQQVTAVWRNGGLSASYDSFVVGSSAVLR